MQKEKLLVLIMNDIVVFPHNEIRLEYDNIYDKEFLDSISENANDLVLIVNPIDTDTKFDITQLPNIGVLSRIKLKLAVPNGKTRVVLEGIERVNVTDYEDNKNLFKASYYPISMLDTADEENYYNVLLKFIDKYVDKVPYMGNAIVSQVDKVDSLSDLCDLIASYINVNFDRKKEYITLIDPIKRCELLIEDMTRDLKLLDLEQKLERNVEKELNDQQKEFFLREKLKAIETELGDVSSKDDELNTLKKKVSKLKCPAKIKNRINREISRYEKTPTASPELSIIGEYLDWMINLPWQKYTKDENDLREVKQILDSSHYALNDVKERILEYLAVKQNTHTLKSPILCLVGPPGVGKTSLALSIAKALGRKSAKISVGGINDEAEIIGHRKTYIGANPGRIIQGIRRAGSANPVFVIDEIDKMTKDIKGDPASALLEVLDPEQNARFSDHYIEEEFDLSNVMFIATANYIEQIPLELRDRLEIINLSSYTEYEKLDIAKDYLIPKELTQHGLTSLQVNITDSAIMYIIRSYTKEAGVRELEREIASLLRKIVKKIMLDSSENFFSIEKKDIEKFLGKPKYFYSKKAKRGEIGVVNGMAYTIFGGDVLPIEATLLKGKGELILTGSLGEVMQESCRIALSYIKSNIKKFNIDEKLLSENDVHIHVPEGAVSKDGPSAGITVTTTLISLLLEKPVDDKIAMTGEITLRGRVLPIGGLKEKTIGAHRAGVRTIFLPKENESDLDEIPKEIKKDIDFILISNYSELYRKIFK
ncbi:MAG: endopeptidase La [Bacilli bacterium]|nr:endopeptidase La [Bacilli bacterium]